LVPIDRGAFPQARWRPQEARAAVAIPELRLIVVIAVAALALLFGIWWLWWRLPKWQVDRLALTIRDPKARADVEDNFRKTVVQTIGAAAVLIGAGFALFQFLQQQQTTQSQFLQQQKAAHDLLISNQVSKGFEQLAGEKIEMRLGGIYALEGVMNDKTSPQYHQPVLEALCAFVREKTIGKTASKDKLATYDPKDKPATDVQAAITVIGRRIKGPGVVDLANVSVPVADLSGADLSGANLRGANLAVATLSSARLINADLSGAILLGANLSGADLSRASLDDANLIAAILGGANLSDAVVRGADLRGASLGGANLINASLRGANLSGADLSGARGLTQAQLDEACGNANTKLPEGLKPPKPCPPPRVP
jgi:hypothetical protein